MPSERKTPPTAIRIRTTEAGAAGHLFRVASPFFAERERHASARFAAAVRAWPDNAVSDAALWPSPFSFFTIARDRFAHFFLPGLFPVRRSRAACLRVSFGALLFLGAANFPPARRALDRPIAIACLAERAPCLPSRTCSISSRPHSPPSLP